MLILRMVRLNNPLIGILPYCSNNIMRILRIKKNFINNCTSYEIGWDCFKLNYGMRIRSSDRDLQTISQHDRDLGYLAQTFGKI